MLDVALTPDSPLRMLGEAIRRLKSLPRDMARRADAFEAMARQIEAQSGGSWTADRGVGTDQSTLFLGRQGETLVIAPDGRMYRGSINRGITIDLAGLTPDYHSLIPLD